MKEINTINRLGTAMEENENIKEISYRSLGMDTKGITLTLKNGILVSILSGEFAQSSDSAPFEIAFLDDRNDREWMPEIFDVADIGDNVLGFQTADDVSYYIEKAVAFRS